MRHNDRMHEGISGTCRSVGVCVTPGDCISASSPTAPTGIPDVSLSLSLVSFVYTSIITTMWEKKWTQSMREGEKRETYRDRKRNWGYLPGEEGPKTSDRDFLSLVVVFFPPVFLSL